MRASVVTGWTPVSVGTADVAVAERAALGTSVRVAAWPAEDLGSALTAVDIELARLEEQASRFRDDSELARINRGRSSVHQPRSGGGDRCRAGHRAVDRRPGRPDGRRRAHRPGL